jgi:hypothetical protein
MSMPPRKIDALRALMAAGDWPRALAFAARFPDLGEHKEAIKRGHEAGAHPRFYESLGKDCAALVAEGIAALKERYGDASSVSASVSPKSGVPQA